MKEAEIGSGAIYLFEREPHEQAWQVKRRLKEQRPHAVILYARPVSKIREYQAVHLVKDYGARLAELGTRTHSAAAWPITYRGRAGQGLLTDRQ